MVVMLRGLKRGLYLTRKGISTLEQRRANNRIRADSYERLKEVLRNIANSVKYNISITEALNLSNRILRLIFYKVF